MAKSTKEVKVLTKEVKVAEVHDGVATVTVTKKGAELPTNKWKEGQKITCHPNLAQKFINSGFAE